MARNNSRTEQRAAYVLSGNQGWRTTGTCSSASLDLAARTRFTGVGQDFLPWALESPTKSYPVPLLKADLQAGCVVTLLVTDFQVNFSSSAPGVEVRWAQWT